MADVETVALARTTVTSLFLLAMLGVLLALRLFTLGTLFDLLWRPLIATAVMGIGIWFIDPTAPPIVELGLRIGAGLVIFSIVLGALWSISGYPTGLEEAIFALLSDYARVARERAMKVRRW
jgi:hypothetical protein